MIVLLQVIGVMAERGTHATHEIIVIAVHLAPNAQVRQLVDRVAEHLCCVEWFCLRSCHVSCH